MNLWIPTIGDAIQLEADWHFGLWPERRNSAMAQALCQPFSGNWWRDYSDQPSQTITLSTGTELVVDRIYIRQGADEFDSVTFVIKLCDREILVGERFWAKLVDVNTIQCHPTSTDNPVGPFAKAKYKADLKPKDPEALAKKETKARSKEDLELARKFVLEQVYAARYDSNHMYGQHVMVLADNMCGQINDQRNGPGWGSNYSYTVTMMLQRISKEDRWVCAATRKLPDGAVERDFRFRWYERTVIRSGGIAVVVKDGAVVSHRAIPM